MMENIDKVSVTDRKEEVLKAISDAIVALEKVHYRISDVSVSESSEEPMSWKLEKIIHSLSLLMMMQLKRTDGPEAL